MKVAQVGRRLAEHVRSIQPQECAALGVDPEVVEAACLAHDLGHPPFGHLGEATLNDLVIKSGDALVTAGSTLSGLYAIGWDMNLYSISPTTGAATLIGPTGITFSIVGGMSAGSSTLYVTDNILLYSLNTTTGAAIFIGTVNIPNELGISTMVTFNGTLYGTAYNRGVPNIYTLNPSTAAATFVAPSPSTPYSFDGLAPIESGLPPPVTIQIKPPAKAPVPINLKSEGVTPVAILSTPGFDATQVNPATIDLSGAPVRSARGGEFSCTEQDVNGDGLPDLVCQIITDRLKLGPTSTQAVLTGMTFSGAFIQGTEAIRVVGN
jgi:hypothetical protein